MDHMSLPTSALIFVALVAGCAASDPHGQRTPGPEDELVILEVAVVEDLQMANHVTFEISLSEPAVPQVICTLDADSDEVHTFVGEQEGQLIAVEGVGLLANEDYSCVASAGERSLDVALQTRPSALEADWTVTGSPEDSQGAYTLFNLFNAGDIQDHKLIIVDPQGRVRFVYRIGATGSGGVAFSALPTQQLLLAGGGDGMHPTLIRWTGEVAEEWPATTTGGVFHHDVEYQPDTDTLATLVTTERETETFPKRSFTGFKIEVRDLGTQAPSWAFDSDQDDLNALLPIFLGDNPLHANAISLLDDTQGPAAFISLRDPDTVVRVDRQDSSISWMLGIGGDFDLIDADGSPLPDADWFFGQHDPELHLDATPPTVLVHDNGTLRPGVPGFSRAVELALDLDEMTATPTWEWTEDGWYETAFGDADALPGGNVLIAQGHCYFCTESTPDRRSAIVEVDREHTGPDAVVWRLDFGEEESGIYRAERVDGCALFHNAKYCQ